jgi:hypothetical protein
MDLNHFIENLLKLQAHGYGELYVYGQNSASGVITALGSSDLGYANHEDGPFDLAFNAAFIRIVAED